MKKSKFTEEQIAFALRQAQTGTRVPEICRKMGICGQTFYRWKRKYGGLGVPELRRLKQLEEENRRLTRMVADLSLDKQMLQDVVKKNSKTSSGAKACPFLQEAYRVSELRACKAVAIGRSTHRYRSRRRDDQALRRRIREIAETRIRYGYLRIHTLLRREGWYVNHKRV